MGKVFYLSLLAFASLFSQDAPLPRPEEETSRFMWEFIKMLIILGGMVGVLIYISWYLKRMTSQKYEKVNEENLIKVIDRRAVSPKLMVYLLEIEGKSIVVGETPQGVVRLLDYTTE
jgi:flagellar protein FliO/FliZ